MRSQLRARPEPWRTTSFAILASSFFALFALFALFGCEDVDPGPRLLPHADAPDRHRDASAEASPMEIDARRTTVRGTVETDTEEGRRSRDVIVVDARGERHEARTNDVGAFAIGDVSLPYDIAVVPPSRAPATLFLGVSRRDPHLRLFEGDDPALRAEPQLVHATVRLRATPCATDAGWITIVTASRSGSGMAMASCAPGNEDPAVEVLHVFREAHPFTGERIDTHVLVENEGGSSFAYAGMLPVPALPGATTLAGIALPEPTAVSAPIVVGVRDVAAAEGLESWQWTTAVAIDVPGQAGGPAASLPFAVTLGSSMRVALPVLPEASLRASVIAQQLRPAGEEATFFRSSEGWSEPLPLTSGVVEISVARAPELVRPTEKGALSRVGAGFEWASATVAGGEDAAPLSTLSVLDASTGAVLFRVLTTEHAIPLDRIGALGAVKLELGHRNLELATVAATTLDDVTSPDAAVRRRSSDRSRRGSTTFLRVPFTVTD